MAPETAQQFNQLLLEKQLRPLPMKTVSLLPVLAVKHKYKHSVVKSAQLGVCCWAICRTTCRPGAWLWQDKSKREMGRRAIAWLRGLPTCAFLPFLIPSLGNDKNGRNRWSFHASRRLSWLSGQPLTRCPRGPTQCSHHTPTPRRHKGQEGAAQWPWSWEIKRALNHYLHPWSWAPWSLPRHETKNL